jgi:formamidopyrimidine-DNA glycosylase
MPELPEVEAARWCLERWARGRTVRKVLVRERRVVGKGGPALASLVGAKFVRFDRRGKHLLIELRRAGAEAVAGRAKEGEGSGKDGPAPAAGRPGRGGRPAGRVDGRVVGLWSHLGMSGKWLLRKTGEEPPRFSRVQIDLSGGLSLHYADLRLFGRLRAVAGAAFDALPVVAALGPDPLAAGVDRQHLAARLQRSGKPVKPQLLDQRVVPGVGNIQASEALFRAAIDPRRPGQSLTPAEVTRLARAIRASISYTLKKLQAEIGAGPISRDVQYVEEPAGPNPFLVYDRASTPCPRCRRGPVTRIVQDGRATFFCPHCQK